MNIAAPCKGVGNRSTKRSTAGAHLLPLSGEFRGSDVSSGPVVSRVHCFGLHCGSRQMGRYTYWVLTTNTVYLHKGGIRPRPDQLKFVCHVVSVLVVCEVGELGVGGYPMSLRLAIFLGRSL